MKIKNIICSTGYAGFYYDDQRAIKQGAKHDGFFYQGKPVTKGFNAIRMPSETISIQVILEDGQIAYGDCATVQYAGAGGRELPFIGKNYIDIIKNEVVPNFINVEADNFKELNNILSNIRVDGHPLHSAINYGMSQALLDTVAKSKKKLMCEVIADEYNTQISNKIIDIYAQSGDERLINSDKMIIKGVSVLPHGLINNVEEKFGGNGEIFLDFLSWLKNRILDYRIDESYKPILHFDMYGTIGSAFGNNNYKRMADFILEAEAAADPFSLHLEGPLDCDTNREDQIEAIANLTSELDKRNSKVVIVVDEWCNTLDDIKAFAKAKAGHMAHIKMPDLGSISNSIEAVIFCKENNMKSFLGGSCTETDRSAQVSSHIALATCPDQMIAKPGMGVDEGYMIIYNEMQRALSVLKER